MALRIASDVFGLAWRHPSVCIGILVLFTPPFFPIIRFFSPLLISTGVFVIAMVSLGPSSQHEVPVTDSWGFRKAPDVKVWEDKVVQEQEQETQRSSVKQRRPGKEGWMNWVKNVEATGLAWVDQKLKKEDWTAPLLDDRNVSILQEAFGKRKQKESVAEASKTDAAVEEEGSGPFVSQESAAKELSLCDATPTESVQRTDVVEEVIFSNPDEWHGGDNAPDAEEQPVVEEVPALVVDDHPSVPLILIPDKSMVREAFVSSPSVNLDEAVRFEDAQRRDLSSLSMVSRSSDVDSPSQPMSTSEKLSVIEALADAIEAQENEPQEAKSKASRVIKALQPSTSVKVTNIIEKLKGFVEEGVPSFSSKEPSAVVIKPVPASVASRSNDNSNRKKISASSDEDTSSDEDVMSDSDSDSEFQIFPQLKPADMKIHPPAKLDLQRMELKAKKSGV